MLRESIEEVRERIERAARRAGRGADEITLVAVTKTFPAAAVREAFELGLREFGENYIQEFEAKRAELGELPGARFHFIGHLQSNKARRAAELFDVVQTIDTAKLARRLSEAAAAALEVMLEVKLSPEQTKGGAPPEALPELIEAVRGCPNLSLTGLMTMPPWAEDPEASRPYFRRLRQLAEASGLQKLSMGMSHDLEVAIEEGATHVRVGTALFGARKYA
jgi:pyridoxal phosphate enzyme (YggS family)